MGKNQIRELLEEWWNRANEAFESGKDDIGKAYAKCAAELSSASKKGSGE